MHNFIPVILSGGAGSRLWPLSREQHPKPFIKLPDGETLLQKAFARAAALTDVTEIITITNSNYYLKSLAEYEKQANLSALPISFLLEPTAKNTAPAVLFAALKVYVSYGADAILLVLPADHLISDLANFINLCRTADHVARTDKIVTFGITPFTPETGYGYIECADRLPDFENVFAAKQFIEKPDLATATHLYQSKHTVWNSGMFCFKAGVLIEQFAQHAPVLLRQAEHCWRQSQTKDQQVLVLHADSFAKMQSISIDYAIMEKSNVVATIACDLAWHDIGSFEAYKKLFTTDSQANTIVGEAILIDAANPKHNA